MAPPKATAASRSKDKVIKRPARGYHKFKNGLLNITPKGGEKELVKVNQQSPLLRLPPEIRNKIWEFALGGMVHRVKESHSTQSSKLAPSPKQPVGISLLRVCCQIYADAAMLPIVLNTFSLDIILFYRRLTAVRKLRSYQRKAITSARIELLHRLKGYITSNNFGRDVSAVLKLLPGLKQLVLRVFYCEYMEKVDKENLRAQFNKAASGTSVNLNIEHTSRAWSENDDSF